MAKNLSKKKSQFCLMLHGRIVLRDRDGEMSDVTHRDIWGLKKFAEDGATAIYILNQIKKRLDLLLMATEHRSQIDASIVRLAVEDIRIDLQEGSEVAGYLFMTQMMFEHSEAASSPSYSRHTDYRPLADARQAGFVMEQGA